MFLSRTIVKTWPEPIVHSRPTDRRSARELPLPQQSVGHTSAQTSRPGQREANPA